ncbi:MAG: putative amidohydrolase YtcJ [Paracoccaceae bacterium]|jgi:predicted amidohydrolase YtcJ
MTQHSLWCNSLARDLAGITKDSPDIPGGVIERDPTTNAPTGILAENACGPVKQFMTRTQPQMTQAVGYAVKYLNRMGFTAFKEPMAFEDDLRTYKAADDRGELTLHAGAHIVRTSPFSPNAVSYDDLERLRTDYASENLRTSFAKLFLDGVAPSFTASFIEPYLESAGYDAASHDPQATLLMQPDDLNTTLIELDQRGFVLKMHAVGDNAVRAALNAIEAARKANGDSGLRHEVSHNSFVHPDDIPRFAKLNAIAEMSPKLWFPNPATAAQIAVLGPQRASRSHPIGDLIKANAELTYASDWPAAAPDANPWTGLSGMLDRKDATGGYPADQAISLAQALPLFTINGARPLGMQSETGSLRAGKWADFIVIDDALSSLTPHQIGAIEVRQTYWKGRPIGKASAFTRSADWQREPVADSYHRAARFWKPSVSRRFTRARPKSHHPTHPAPVAQPAPALPLGKNLWTPQVATGRHCDFGIEWSYNKKPPRPSQRHTSAGGPEDNHTQGENQDQNTLETRHLTPDDGCTCLRRANVVAAAAGR